MNPDNGAMECQIVQDGYNKISSLNLFSPTGNAMISGMGQTICIWKQKPVEEVKYEEKPTNMTDIVVEEWPGFKPQKAKKNPTKKSKKIAWNVYYYESLDFIYLTIFVVGKMNK